jgi:hypothetical protein
MNEPQHGKTAAQKKEKSTAISIVSGLCQEEAI